MCSARAWVSRVRAGRAWWLVCVVLLAAQLARADDRVSRLAEQLASSDDFRVRTQAALALGASKSKRAVQPLCRGLGDTNTTVRAAAAAALGKLSMGGAGCLKKRLAEESSSSVKATIKKALAQLEGGGEPAGPAITGDTRYYVALGKTADKTGRGGQEVDDMVRGTMRRATLALDGYAVAPDSETQGGARGVFVKYPKLKGFYLAPKVMPPQYAGGKLVVKVEIAIFTYPDKTLRGSLPVKLTQQDVTDKDKAAEDELIRMAAERAVEKFASNVDRIE